MPSTAVPIYRITSPAMVTILWGVRQVLDHPKDIQKILLCAKVRLFHWKNKSEEQSNPWIKTCSRFQTRHTSGKWILQKDSTKLILNQRIASLDLAGCGRPTAKRSCAHADSPLRNLDSPPVNAAGWGSVRMQLHGLAASQSAGSIPREKQRPFHCSTTSYGMVFSLSYRLNPAAVKI